MKPLGDNCPNCGATVTPSLTRPEIQCEFCQSTFANPRYEASKSRPPKPIKIGFPPPQKQPAPIQPDPFVQPAKDIGNSLIKSFVAAISWYILAPILFVMFFVVFGCCFFWFAASTRTHRQRPMADHEISRQKRESTRTSLSSISKYIKTKCEKSGEIFSDEEGASCIASQSNDGWGRPFRYEQISEQSFLIRSAGADGVFLNSDDRYSTEYLASNYKTKKPPTANNLMEALKLINESIGYYGKSIGIDWIVKNEPKLKSDQADQIFSVVLKASRPADSKAEARLANLVPVIFPIDDANALFDRCVECADAGYMETTKQLVGLMAKQNQKESVEKFYNFPVKPVRLEATSHLDNWKYSDEKRLQLCMKDLQDELRRDTTIERLVEMEVDPKKKLEVGKAILKSLRDVKYARRIRYIRSRRLDSKMVKRVLATYAVPELIPDLCLTLEATDSFTTEIADALAKHKDPRAIKKLVEVTMERGAKGSRCQKSLISIGVDAEPYVWKILTTGTDYQKKEACEILGSIGTKNSLVHLTPLLASKSSSVKYAATEAIAKIERAKRAPSGKAKTE